MIREIARLRANKRRVDEAVAESIRVTEALAEKEGLTRREWIDREERKAHREFIVYKATEVLNR